MSQILILGATSVIAEYCARQWATRGDALFLVGRNSERLDLIRNDLLVRGAGSVSQYCTDLRNIEEHKLIIEQARTHLGKINIVLVAHGTLSDQKKCETDIQYTLGELQTNVLSTVSLLTHLANVVQNQNEGVLAVISSVAGDRGRASNYVYGSSKAFITAFLSGLRQRLTPFKVSVITIKPGFVDTPMTAGFKKGMLWASPQSVAARIVRGIDSRQDEIYVPGFWRVIMFAIKSLPTSIFKYLRL